MKTALKALALAVIGAATLHAQDVHTDYDHHANFEQYRTYCIARLHAGDQLVEGRLRDAVTQQLTQHGLQPSDNCDVSISAIGMVRNKQEYNSFYEGFGPGWGWRGGWGWGGWGGGPVITSIDNIPVGLTIIDVYDNRTHSLLFRGSAATDLSKKNEDKNTEKLYKEVQKIFDRYPHA